MEKIQQIKMSSSQINAINVTMQLLIQVFWGFIWKYTAEKSQTNLTSVNMPAMILVREGHTWNNTVEKSQTNEASVILHPLRQAI